MALIVRQENVIIGIKMKRREFKIKQYADDTQILSEFHEMSILKIIEILDKFATAFWITINSNKPENLRLGSIIHSDYSSWYNYTSRPWPTYTNYYGPNYNWNKKPYQNLVLAPTNNIWWNLHNQLSTINIQTYFVTNPNVTVS